MGSFRPFRNLDTLGWKERDNCMFLPWQEQHPLYKENKDIVYAKYACGHFFYNGSSKEVMWKIKKGYGRKKHYSRMCPKCFGNWLGLPAYARPAEPIRRYGEPYNMSIDSRISKSTVRRLA